MQSLRRPVRRHGGGRSAVLGARRSAGGGRSAVVGGSEGACSAVVGGSEGACGAVVGGSEGACSAVVGGSEGAAQALMELERRGRPLYARRPERAPPQPLVWKERMHPEEHGHCRRVTRDISAGRAACGAIVSTPSGAIVSTPCGALGVLVGTVAEEDADLDRAMPRHGRQRPAQRPAPRRWQPCERGCECRARAHLWGRDRGAVVSTCMRARL
jgi:hypothetical protein